MDPLYLYFFTKIASTEGFLVASVLIVICLLLARKRQQAGIFSLAAMGLMAGVQVLKETLRVARPDTALIETVGYSFPSGHAAGALFLALCVCYLSRKQSAFVRYSIYALSIGLALLIGISRVQLGVHTLLQVIAGFVVGSIVAALFIHFCKKAP